MNKGTSINVLNFKCCKCEMGG